MPPKNCAITPKLKTGRVVVPYAYTLFETAYAEGVNGGELLTAAGLTALGEQAISVNSYLAMFELALRRTDALFGFRLGRSVKPTTYGVNGILLLACPSLGDALKQVLRFEALVHDLGRSSMEQQGDTVVYSWRNDCSDHPCAGALSESVFTGIHTCATWLAGRPMTGVITEFAHPKPAGAMSEIETLAGGTVRYGAAANRAIFPQELLRLPIPHANSEMLPMLQAHAESLLATQQGNQSPLLTQARHALTARLGRGSVKLEQIAADLHLSSRTLQRRLAAEGVAFQQLLDTTRHEIAMHYLGNSPLPVAQIAYLLGYQDAAAFNNAFKAWQGKTPGQYRQSRR